MSPRGGVGSNQYLVRGASVARTSKPAGPRLDPGVALSPPSPLDAGSLDGWAEQKIREHPGLLLDVREARDGHISVDRIVVEGGSRRQGVGGRIMRELLSYADRNGRVVSLTPSTDFGGTKAGLERFYRSLGFVPNKGPGRHLEISDSWVREPRPS